MPDSPYLAQLRKQLNDQNAAPRPKPAPAAPPPPPEPKNTHDWAMGEDGMPQRVLREYPDEKIERPEAMTRQGNEDARKWVHHEDIAHTPMDADVGTTGREYADPDASATRYAERRDIDDPYRNLPMRGAIEGASLIPGLHNGAYKTFTNEAGEQEIDTPTDFVSAAPPAARSHQRDAYVDEAVPTRARSEAGRAMAQAMGVPAPPPTGYDEATQRQLEDERRKKAMAPPADWLNFGDEKR